MSTKQKKTAEKFLTAAQKTKAEATIEHIRRPNFDAKHAREDAESQSRRDSAVSAGRASPFLCNG